MDINRLVDIKISGSKRFYGNDPISIISQHPNPTEYKKYTKSLLHIWVDDVQVISFLLTHYDFDINIRDGYGQTPIYIAAKNMLPKTVLYYYYYGADINCEQTNGLTPLTSAILYTLLTGENLEFLKVLITLSDVNYSNKFGDTALHYLQFTPSYNCDLAIEIAALLLAAGADPQMRNIHNLTISDILRKRCDLNSLAKFLTI